MVGMHFPRMDIRNGMANNLVMHGQSISVQARGSHLECLKIKKPSSSMDVVGGMKDHNLARHIGDRSEENHPDYLQCLFHHDNSPNCLYYQLHCLDLKVSLVKRVIRIKP
jgi:hypothetical protein